jgi:formate hydrogenlyase subunit 3/multisubunit Na+/H+ antiporter MnhD subunit
VQRDFGRLFGYAVLTNLGYLLLAFVAGGSQSLALALLYTVTRAMPITLMAAALAILRHRATTDEFAGLGGIARRLPIATMGLMIGGLALAGFPLTAGLPTHWAVIRPVWNWAQPFSALAQEAASSVDTVTGSPWVGVIVLLALFASSGGIVIGLLRGLSAMLGADPREDVARQPVIASLMVLALIGLVIVLGIYPQLFLEPVLSTAEALSSF